MDRVNARAQFPFLIYIPYSVPWTYTLLERRSNLVRFWPNLIFAEKKFDKRDISRRGAGWRIRG